MKQRRILCCLFYFFAQNMHHQLAPSLRHSRALPLLPVRTAHHVIGRTLYHIFYYYSSNNVRYLRANGVRNLARIVQDRAKNVTYYFI